MGSVTATTHQEQSTELYKCACDSPIAELFALHTNILFHGVLRWRKVKGGGGSHTFPRKAKKVSQWHKRGGGSCLTAVLYE